MRAKIFHVITHLELGGAQKITLMTLERLPRERYELGLVSGPEGLLVDWANRIPAVTRVWVPSLVREVRPIKDIIALIKMWRVFRRERPMLVHTHCPKAGILGRWAARLAGVPLIFHTAHGFGFNDFQRPIVRNFYVWLERITSKITTEHVFVSYENADKAEKLGLTRRGEWILSRSGIEIEEYMQPFPRRTKLAEWGIAEDKVTVGMVACFKPEKSPVDFVDIAARILKRTDNVHFLMIGDGELRPSVEARIRYHAIEERITLLGWQTIEVMPEIYRNLDIVVLTSLWEGLPRVFAEAMASGLPIVATRVGGAREAIIDGETGFLFQPHDVEGMAGAVLRLIADPGLRQRMGSKGKEHVVEFDVRTAIAGLESEYRKRLESGQ
jgi:glycosyltransferase involved in cell wall biosynthesis